MKVGVHVSIAGGIHLAVERAVRLGCETFQIFLTNPRSWRVKPLDPPSAEAFKKARKRHKLSPVFVHLPYLPNLASRDEEIYSKSIDSLSTNLDRCEEIGAEYLVAHLGKGEAGEESQHLMAEGVKKAWREKKRNVTLLVENTAGQGKELGATLEELSEMYVSIGRYIKRIGLCIDTCHAHAAGYELRTNEGLDGFLRQITHLFDKESVRLVHLNDSLRSLGSHVDRHQHIGKGQLGIDAFRLIVNHPLLRTVPGILETPKKSDADDLLNLATIRGLMLDK